MSSQTFTPDTYMSTMAAETWREFGFCATNAEELVSWQRAFRTRLAKHLGLNVIAERGPCELLPEQEEEVQQGDHIRELWTIQSEPGFRIPFYVMRPLQQDGPLPLILAPHGHGTGHIPYVGLWESEQEREDALKGERDIGLQAVRAGYIAIVPILRAYHRLALQSWGQVSPGKQTCQSMQMQALMFGRTLIGDRVHDMQRLIDYAATRGDIDDSRIVITGNSGGGTISLFAAAMDERIDVCIPGSYFCTFEASIGSIHHCPCNYIPGIMRLGEMYDVAGLIAPRPILVVNGKEDRIFPIEATREAFERLQHIYSIAGAADRCELYVGDEGHRYYKERVWPFISEWL